MPYVLGHGWVDDISQAQQPQSLAAIASPDQSSAVNPYGPGGYGIGGPGSSSPGAGPMPTNYSAVSEWLRDRSGNALAAFVPGKGWVSGQNWTHNLGDEGSRSNLEELAGADWTKGRDAQLASTGKYILGSVPSYSQTYDPSGLDVAGMSWQDQRLFNPDSTYGEAGYRMWGDPNDSSIGRPEAKYIKRDPEETLLQAISGGANSPGIWAPSPLGMFTAGTAGYLAGAGALANAGAAAGALEGAGAFGGEAFGAAANSAGAFGGSVAPWTAGAGVGGGMGAGADIFGNFDMGSGLGGTSGFTGGAEVAGGSLSGLDPSWGVNPEGGNVDFGSENMFGYEENPWGDLLRDVGTQSPPTNLQDMMTNLDKTSAGRTLLNTITGGSSDGVNSLLSQLTMKLGEAGAKGLLGKLLSGDASGDDYTKLLGALGSTALGVYGSNNQAKSLSDLAAKYQEYGAPSRARYEASMSPGFDPRSMPGYAGALDSSMEAMLRKLSAQSGNPFSNPGGLIEANKAIVSGTALPAINEYQRLNANTGFGQSMNAALGLQTGAIGADRGMTTALASGLENLTAPPSSLQELLRRLQGSGTSGAFSLV